MKVKSIIPQTFLLLFTLFSATFTTAQRAPMPFENDSVSVHFDVIKDIDSAGIVQRFIKAAEGRALAPARKILEQGRKMALQDSTILPGTCWTYANAIFKRAGYAKSKQYVYKSKKRGPYADTDLIQPGDWLYFINHSYHNIDHSVIFVGWLDKENKLGLTIGYEGRYHKKPGRYKVYNLKDVFFITRAGKKIDDSDLVANKQ